eukprot:4387043-Pyramimonas_sp.AAC.1
MAPEPASPRGARPKGRWAAGEDGPTAAAITAMTEQMKAAQAQQQAIQEHLSRMQTGQNFHAFALARVLGVGIGAKAGDAQRAVITGLPPPSTSPPDHQGLAPACTPRGAAPTAPGFGAAPRGSAPAMGPRAPPQSSANMAKIVQD